MHAEHAYRVWSVFNLCVCCGFNHPWADNLLEIVGQSFDIVACVRNFVPHSVFLSLDSTDTTTSMSR